MAKKKRSQSRSLARFGAGDSILDRRLQGDPRLSLQSPLDSLGAGQVPNDARRQASPQVGRSGTRRPEPLRLHQARSRQPRNQAQKAGTI